MKHGHHGRYVKINLEQPQAELIPLGDDLLRRYIGGVGLGAWVLFENSPAGYDPLGSEAPMVVSLSPLVGTPLTTSAKFSIVAKSPLTHRICDAMCSSHFALAAKKLGVDAFSIHGRLDSLHTLFIEGMNSQSPILRLESASEYQGLSAAETERLIRKAHGRDWQIISIGPAGEMQIPYATISHDGRHAGRGGLGAVMGSKNLKAIAVRGDSRASVHNINKTLAIARSLSDRSFTPATAKYREIGTVANLLVFNRLEVLPARNFQAGHFHDAENLVPENLSPASKLAKNSCASCTIGCEHIFELKSSANGKSGTRMEYESLFALGPLLGISDPGIVLEAASLCDDYGLDTISTGGTIAFLLECRERGILNHPFEHEHSDLKYGNGHAIISLIRDICSSNPGELAGLSRLGSRAASLVIGGNSIQFAAQVKGMEMPGYHPSRLHAMALGLAVGCRGADHNRSGAYEVDFREKLIDPEQIALAVIETENRSAIMDSMILCKFIRGVFNDFYLESAEMLQAVTGYDYSKQELIKCAQQIVELRKAFNIREGWSPAEDALPEMIFQHSTNELTAESSVLTREKLQVMIRLYNISRGWSEDGFLRTAGGLDLSDHS